jgi:hypothetical protein
MVGTSSNTIASSSLDAHDGSNARKGDF